MNLIFYILFLFGNTCSIRSSVFCLADSFFFLLQKQVHQSFIAPSIDPAVVDLELGLVDVFLSLCRFEWQSGYQELATALFQSEIEYSLFCPSLVLSEQSKQRLFKHFWSSNGARVGEDGALGWSTWLEKEEEQRQRLISEESSNDVEKGGWTGWFEPLSNQKETNEIAASTTENDMAFEESDHESEMINIEQKDDIEALLKKVGIDAAAEADSQIKDTKIWTRWSKAELERDSEQWMPIRAKSGLSLFNSPQPIHPFLPPSSPCPPSCLA